MTGPAAHLPDQPGVHPGKQRDRPAALDLIRATLKAHALVGEVSDDEVAAIWEQAGGNPLAIRQAVQALYRAPGSHRPGHTVGIPGSRL